MAILPTLEKESVDLIYIDPPFFSNRNYEIIWGDDAEFESFKDRWEGGINVYVEWMKDRIIELHRVLKPTGSFFLHCDWHACHYLKLVCDQIFGYSNFRNEIIWCYTGPGSPGMRQFMRKHDNIFWYSKSDKWTFNADEIRVPHSEKTLENYKAGLVGSGFVGADHVLPKGGKIPEDYWPIAIAARSTRERLPYPTQKPEALLNRIIRAASNKGDLVLDVFCGCGTSMAVAYKTGRRWIGVDISPSAIVTIKNRLARDHVPENSYEIRGMPTTDKDLKGFTPADFQYWAINEMHGTPSPRLVHDMGIDGFSFVNHFPIQVKQSEGVGRNVVDNFETAMRRYYKTKKDMSGYIIAFSFTRGAREEVARAKSEGIKITLIKVQDILDKKFVIRQELETDNEDEPKPKSRQQGLNI